jgi:alkylhydroperoxidase family enzyme
MPNIPVADLNSVPEAIRPIAADNEFYGIMAHRPEILEVWAELDKVFFGPSSIVDNELKEEARRTLAQDVGCVFCKSLGAPASEPASKREMLAVAFADQMIADHKQIDSSTFEALREEFSNAELVELISWLCFKLGSNVFGALMSLTPATDEQVQGYADFVAVG